MENGMQYMLICFPACSSHHKPGYGQFVGTHHQLLAPACIAKLCLLGISQNLMQHMQVSSWRYACQQDFASPLLHC